MGALSALNVLLENARRRSGLLRPLLNAHALEQPRVRLVRVAQLHAVDGHSLEVVQLALAALERELREHVVHRRRLARAGRTSDEKRARGGPLRLDRALEKRPDGGALGGALRAKACQPLASWEGCEQRRKTV